MGRRVDCLDVQSGGRESNGDRLHRRRGADACSMVIACQAGERTVRRRLADILSVRQRGEYESDESRKNGSCQHLAARLRRSAVLSFGSDERVNVGARKIDSSNTNVEDVDSTYVPDEGIQSVGPDLPRSSVALAPTIRSWFCGPSHVVLAWLTHETTSRTAFGTRSQLPMLRAP